MVAWRPGPDPLGSGEGEGVSEARAYRLGTKVLIGGGLLYGGYRLLGPTLAATARHLAQRLPVHAARARGLVQRHLAAGDYGSAARSGLGYLTAPLSHGLGARSPQIVQDLRDTARLLLEGSIDRQTLLEPFLAARAGAGKGPLRRLLISDVLGLPASHPLLERRPHGRETLSGGLRRVRRYMGLVRRRAGDDAYQAMLETPIDRALLRTRGGRVLDLRSLDPEHWGLNVWDRFKIPESLSFQIPSQIPLIGGKDVPVGGSKPLKWLSQLFLPTELLRRKPIQRVLKGPRDPQGIEQRFLYSGGKVRPFHVRTRRGERPLRGFDEALPGPSRIQQNYEAWWRGRQERRLGDLRSRLATTTSLEEEHRLGRRIAGLERMTARGPRRPWRGWEYAVGDVTMENARIAEASSPLGKGVRIRTGQYQHDLSRFLQQRGIAKNSWSGRVLQKLDQWGIGPHLTSPVLVEQGGRVETHAKMGALEQLYRWATGRPAQTASPFVAGELSHQHFVPYTAAGGIAKKMGARAGTVFQGLSDYANYSVLRPLYLMEEKVGIGLRGGKHAAESLWRIMSRVVIPAYFAAQGLRFADFAIGQATGMAPSDVALGAYTGLQVGRAEVLEATGARDLARRLEEVFPGSVSSPGSMLIRTVGGGAVGTAAGGILAKKLARRLAFFQAPLIRNLIPILAAGMGALFFGSDPIRGPESLRRRYSGEELVPIRRSRFWELGRDSYFGRDIMYWRPHGLAMRRNRVWEKSTYGSEWEYWKYGSGLSPLRYLDPYYLERKHAKDRPYPETGTLFGDVPLVGSLLEATIGRVLKPVRRHPLLEASMEIQGERWGGDRKVPRDVGERLGLPGGDLAHPEGVVSRFRPGQVIGKAFNHMADWLGMQGFLWKATAEKVTGTKSLFGSDRQLETSDRIAGSERWFYGMELGGGFQTFPVPGSGLLATEFTRRLIPHRDRTIELVNPIPNQMPSWLPGPRSKFSSDREFYLQGGFHTGDPFSKIHQGEARLPGPGYESVRPLHSGIPGVYDPIDRLLILEDVAPYSEAAKHYRALVQGWTKAGVIDEYWKRQVFEARTRRDDRERSKETGTPNRFAEPGLEDLRVTISDVTSPTTFKTYEHPYTFRLAGLETKKRNLHRRQLEEGNAQTISEAEANIRAAQQSLRERMTGLIGETVTIQIARDQAARYQQGKVLAILPGVSEEAARGPLGAKDQGGLAAYLQGNWATRRLANLYYGAATAANEIPGPLRWPLNKLFPMKDPVEDYFQFQVLSSRFGMWETPYESYLKPWARSVRGYVQDYIPEDLERLREERRQFQRLRFLKATENLGAASAAQDPELMVRFTSEARKTYLGVNPRSPLEAAMYSRGVLESTERDYLEPFKRLRSTEERKRALKLLPEEAQYVLTNLWRQDLPKGTGFEDEDLSQAARRFNPYRYPAEELSEFLETTEVPGKDWAGWDPRVSIDAVKVKWIENRGDNVHNYGLWESDRRRVRRQFPDLEAPSLEEEAPSRPRFRENLARLGLEADQSISGELEELEIRRGPGRARGYDSERARFESSPVYFSEPA